MTKPRFPGGIAFCARPMLMSGMLFKHKDGGWLVIVDSEQPHDQKVIACWHEIAHFLVGEDEEKAEALAKRLAVAVPEILDIVGIDLESVSRATRSSTSPEN